MHSFANESAQKRQTFMSFLVNTMGEGISDIYALKDDIDSKEEQLFPLMFIGRPSLKNYVYPEHLYKYATCLHVYNDYSRDFVAFARDLLIACRYAQPISADIIATLKTIAEDDDFKVKVSSKEGRVCKVMAKSTTKFSKNEVCLERTEDKVVITKKFKEANGVVRTIVMEFNPELNCLYTMYEKNGVSITSKQAQHSVRYEDEFYFNDLGFEIKHLATKTDCDNGKTTAQKREILRVIDPINNRVYEVVNEFCKPSNSAQTQLDNHVYLLGKSEYLTTHIQRFETEPTTKDVYNFVASMLLDDGANAMMTNTVEESVYFNDVLEKLQNDAKISKKVL